MSDISIGEKIKALCGRCRGERNCEVRGFHRESGGDDEYNWTTDWYLLVCCGCDFPFAQTVSTDSASVMHHIDERGDYFEELIATVEVWPAIAKRTHPEWFAHGFVESDAADIVPLSAALSEVYRSLDAGLLVLSAIGIRTAFDVASQALSIDPNLAFANKLEKLSEAGRILPSQKIELEVLIDAGSAAAHRSWKPTFDEINLQMEILEEFIFNAFVLPSREVKKAEKISKLKDSVPKRPQRQVRTKKK